MTATKTPSPTKAPTPKKTSRPSEIERLFELIATKRREHAEMQQKAFEFGTRVIQIDKELADLRAQMREWCESQIAAR